MATFKLTFLLFLLSIATTAAAQNPCNLSGHEIRGACLPNEGKCPTGFAMVAVTDYSTQCIRLQAEDAKVDIKVPSEAPTVAPQVALIETFTARPMRKAWKEKKTFLASKKAIYGSDVLFWFGTVADQVSTTRKGGKESNPFLQNDKGGLATGRYYVIHGALFGVIKVIERKFPELGVVLKMIVGGAHVAAGVNNIRKTP
jgi:hypothetical protein